MKKALIFGITGQDGSYLAKYLISKKYQVFGVSKKKNFKNLKNLKIFQKIKIFSYKNKLDTILKRNFSEIYFLGGQSKVFSSFIYEDITYSSQINPVIQILEHIRKQKNKSKFLYASSSEIFGNYKNFMKKNENSYKDPISPYGLSKLIGFEMIKSYREMFKLPVCSVIFFNHESSLRSKGYVVKKIVDYVKKNKMNKKLKLGNINIKRDWGWAPDYMEVCKKILSNKKIDDYIIATGITTSLREVIKKIFLKNKLNYKKFIEVDKKNVRKYDISQNYADIKKIKKNINWIPKTNLDQIISKMFHNEH